MTRNFVARWRPELVENLRGEVSGLVKRTPGIIAQAQLTCILARSEECD